MALQDHQLLLLDPGVVQRIDEVVPLAQKALMKNPFLSTAQLREVLSSIDEQSNEDALPTVELFRGMMMPDDEAAAVKVTGIRPVPFRKGLPDATQNGVLASRVLGGNN